MTQNETESVNDMILLLNSEASDVEVAAKIVETLEAVPTEGIKPWLKAFVSSAGETDRLRHVNNLMTKGELGGRWGSIVRRMSDRDQELTKGEERYGDFRVSVSHVTPASEAFLRDSANHAGLGHRVYLLDDGGVAIHRPKLKHHWSAPPRYDDFPDDVRALMQSRWGEGKSRIVLCQDGKILEGFPTWPRTA